MNRTRGRLCLALSLLIVITGCWDSTEVNDLAIELAWGIDKAPNQKLMISTQAIIPAKISGGQGGGGTEEGGASAGKPYFVVASDGMNTLDAVQRIQSKLSRQVYRGHRRVIVIGEAMARQGIKDILDTYTRDPNLKLRTDIFVVKGNSAKNFLNVSYPLENIPALGVLGEYNQLGTLMELGLMSFLLAATSEGTSPTVPAVAIGMSPPSKKEDKGRSPADEEGFRIAGTALFNKDLKLVGFLNVEEGRAMRWVSGRLKKITVPAAVPQEKGNVSMDLYKIDRKIEPVVQGDNIKFLVTLTGGGAIRENNTRLDLTQTENIALLEDALNKQVEETVLRTITKVQKKYGTDVFGFGETIHRKDPPLWNSVKNNWESAFREAEISVTAKLKVRRIGVTGPSLQLKPNEIKK
ncbi:Ger(x)C family spore germination protein [Paenibacillus nanensis]|uniref:Ger(X)C family spore germination protein n=1 Tax=Paenibacillus nanensis TaxID=393251 RepID=A0A3A1UTC0_9BACL|nr:Ger(x)C family spore germination protein [Paenibacillus nanensis]RIX51046.1 Ger(x)C family spore germination protein [Paenibacillus nanensis]